MRGHATVQANPRAKHRIFQETNYSRIKRLLQYHFRRENFKS